MKPEFPGFLSLNLIQIKSIDTLTNAQGLETGNGLDHLSTHSGNLETSRNDDAAD